MPDIGHELKRQALNRFQHFSGTPIISLLTPSPEFQDVPSFDFLLEHRDDICQWIGHASHQDLLAFFMRHIMDYLYTHNQFLDISPDHQRKLQHVYLQFTQNYLTSVCTAEDRHTLREQLTAALAKHQSRLASFVTELGRENGGLDFAFAEPVCSQYSPEFQQTLLGLSLDAVQVPVLDLGCGQEAHLVRHLREMGIPAYGVDRMVEPADHLLRSDWFGFPLGTWGTIISHMAFSLHFSHHHLRVNGHPEQYAARYMEILRALRLNGQFIYTPGLPFIETLLPEYQYHVEHVSNHTTIITKLVL